MSEKRFDKQRKKAMDLNDALARSMADIFNKTTSANYWARVIRGMDFSSEDKFNFARYNCILWAGLMRNN